MGKQKNSSSKSNSNNGSKQSNNTGSQVNIGKYLPKVGAESTKGVKTSTRPKK